MKTNCWQPALLYNKEKLYEENLVNEKPRMCADEKKNLGFMTPISKQHRDSYSSDFHGEMELRSRGQLEIRVSLSLYPFNLLPVLKSCQLDKRAKKCILIDQSGMMQQLVVWESPLHFIKGLQIYEKNGAEAVLLLIVFQADIILL